MDDPRAAEILEKLQEEGGRVTRTRRMILDVMLSAEDHHLTAADVVDAVRKRDSSFPESTVYRTLTRLEQLGVIAPMPSPGATTYHVADNSHIHAVCDQCGAVFELDPKLLSSLARTLHDRCGFLLDPHRTIAHGRCRDCAGAASSTS